MIHPLFKLVATQPQLVVGHLLGYGQLVAVQAGEAAAQLRIHAMLLGGVLIGSGVGLGLGGISLLLFAALPAAQMPMPWMLVAVPLVPLTGAGICALGLKRRPESWSLKPLREQFAADAALLEEAGNS